MGAYFQMGHDTENLIGLIDLEEFRGAILSPVNREPDMLKGFVPKARKAGIDDIILDPQFYFPKAARGKLGTHPYFPSDFDSADFSADSWWNGVVDKLAVEGCDLGVDAIATPVLYPNAWDDKYWVRCRQTFAQLKSRLAKTSLRPLYTVFVNISSLQTEPDVLRVASIISESEADEYLFVLVTGIEPRRELLDEAGLCGFMQLIHLLSQDAAVTVAYTCSDVVLYKVAGAENCATGKFFNLRRFTTARFDDSEQSGGQMPYWFAPGLLAFLRQADVLRLKRLKLDSMLNEHGFGTIWTAHIEEHLAKSPPEPWIAKSWRQFLSSFGKMEKAFQGPSSFEDASKVLKTAEARWKELTDKPVLMDEDRNDGRWIRPWRQALEEFRIRVSAP